MHDLIQFLNEYISLIAAVGVFMLMLIADRVRRVVVLMEDIHNVATTWHMDRMESDPSPRHEPWYAGIADSWERREMAKGDKED